MRGSCLAQGNLWRLVVTGLIGGILLTAYASSAIGPFLDMPTRLTANVVAAVMRLIGVDALRDGVVVFRSADFAYEIYYRCIGVLPMSALAIGILASPAGPRAKLIGLAIGIPLVLLLNLVRLVNLFSIGVNYPEYFWIAHRVLWEAVMLGMTILIWVVWLRRSLRHQYGEPKVVTAGQ